MSLMRALWWLAVFCVVAATTHLAWVLFLPGLRMEGVLRAARQNVPVNHLAVLAPDVQAVLFPGDTTSDVRAVCPFVLGGGTLTLSAMMPDTPWVISIYAPQGDVLYALGHEQAAVNAVKVNVRQSGGWSEWLGLSAREESAALDGWTLDMAGNSGVAVLWAALPNSALAASARHHMQQSGCMLAPSAPQNNKPARSGNPSPAPEGAG